MATNAFTATNAIPDGDEFHSDDLFDSDDFNGDDIFSEQQCFRMTIFSRRRF